MAWFGKKKKPITEPTLKGRKSFFALSTHDLSVPNDKSVLPGIMASLKAAQPTVEGIAMDDSSSGVFYPKQWTNSYNTMSESLINWYATQGFINHQIAGIASQHWLINKACTMPADDAIRKGYEVVSEDGEDLDPEATKIIKRYDRKFRINAQMREFIRKGRIFGVRIAMFKVESTDPEYYLKPFNIDGVAPGSYKGIVQVDPYWCAPILDAQAASEPDSLHFYEPTWWLISGKKVHRTHLVVYVHAEPVDVLKPQYLYGGIPLPQMIMERVYAAERTANEAPLLALSKRTSIWLTDMEKAVADMEGTGERMDWWSRMRDNYGIKLGDKEGDEFAQYDTSLADMDALIMTQYQLVCSIANCPSTKMLGTSPKGFGAAGDYEIASYHEFLETIQENDLSPFLDRHHALVQRAYVFPKIPEAGMVEVTVTWRPLDTPTAKELAETNLVKIQGDDAAIAAGMIDSQEGRNRLARDKTSGYNEMGLSESEAPGIPEMEEDPDSQALLSNAEKPHLKD